MASVIEYRVMLNRPGPGWYWEVIHKHEIVARGLADNRTHRPQKPHSRREISRSGKVNRPPQLTGVIHGKGGQS